MSYVYQELLDELLKEDYKSISKLYLIYELEACLIDKIDDDLIEMIYQAFIDNKNYNSIYDFVLAIQDWCCINETAFGDIKDYRKMLDEIK